MVSKIQAASHKTKKYLKENIQLKQEEAMKIQSRLKVKTELTHADQAQYYSHWSYGAVHILIAVPQFQNIEALESAIDLPRGKLLTVLEFLITTGLVERIEDKYVPGSQHIHLDNSSPFILQHHQNWRRKAQEKIDSGDRDDIHYSVLFSLSREAVDEIKENILTLIKKNLEVVGPSKEETVYVFTSDFFKLA